MVRLTTEDKLKEYAVFDQRFPDKHKDGWTVKLVPCGSVQALDSDHAFLLAKSLARFPVLFNHDNYVEACWQEKRIEV